MTSFRLTLGLCACVLALSACSNGSGSGQEDVESQIVRVTPQPTAEDGVVQPTPVPEGNIVNQYDLEVSWCFNRYELYSESLDESSDITTEVDCRRPHDGEAYATYFNDAGPDTPYPGGPEMERWANIACLQGFEEFVGKPYELSELHIGTIRPTEETWTTGPHREVICYVYAPNAQLFGPMASSEI